MSDDKPVVPPQATAPETLSPPSPVGPAPETLPGPPPAYAVMDEKGVVMVPSAPPAPAPAEGWTGPHDGGGDGHGLSGWSGTPPSQVIPRRKGKGGRRIVFKNGMGGWSGNDGKKVEVARSSVPGVKWRAAKEPRPNDRCPCGSGKKHKKCCGRVK